MKTYDNYEVSEWMVDMALSQNETLRPVYGHFKREPDHKQWNLWAFKYIFSFWIFCDRDSEPLAFWEACCSC